MHEMLYYNTITEMYSPVAIVTVHIQVVLIDFLIPSLGGETSSVYPLQKAINCIMKVEAILDRKFLKPPFKETIKPPGPGKLLGISLLFEHIVMIYIHMYLNKGFYHHTNNFCLKRK